MIIFNLTFLYQINNPPLYVSLCWNSCNTYTPDLYSSITASQDNSVKFKVSMDKLKVVKSTLSWPLGINIIIIIIIIII